jgi:hypothetical protein
MVIIMTTKKINIHYYSVFIILLSTLYATTINARQIGDVTLPDSVTIEGTNVTLRLNGAGYRTKFVFKVYVGALYTVSQVNTRDAVQALTGPKRVAMHMVYDEVSHEKMADAWQDGFEENNNDESLQNLQSRLNTYISYFPDLKAGDTVWLDYIPSTGTRITINGKEQGIIEGDDFYSALLDVWLGEEPADEDLKAAMLSLEED